MLLKQPLSQEICPVLPETLKVHVFFVVSCLTIPIIIVRPRWRRRVSQVVPTSSGILRPILLVVSDCTCRCFCSFGGGNPRLECRAGHLTEAASNKAAAHLGTRWPAPAQHSVAWVGSLSPVCERGKIRYIPARGPTSANIRAASGPPLGRLSIKLVPDEAVQ